MKIKKIDPLYPIDPLDPLNPIDFLILRTFWQITKSHSFMKTKQTSAWLIYQNGCQIQMIPGIVKFQNTGFEIKSTVTDHFK